MYAERKKARFEKIEEVETTKGEGSWKRSPTPCEEEGDK